MEENVLHNIFGNLVRSCHAQAKGIEHRSIAVVQGCQRTLVSPLDAPKQVCILAVTLLSLCQSVLLHTLLVDNE
jgi:hypothetical protein